MEVKTIEECFYHIQNGVNIKQGVLDGGYPITRIETISNDKFNRNKMGYAGIDNLDRYSSYVLEDGDLLMSHINSIQYLGRTVLYERQGSEKIIHGMNLLRLKADRSLINPRYARYYFASHTFKKQIMKITKKSVNQASFAVSDLKRIKIGLPKLVEQEEIAIILDKINELIFLYKTQIQKLEYIVKSRFVEMFGDPVVNPNAWKKVALCELADIRIGPFGSLLHKEDYIRGGHPLVNPSHIINGKIVTDSQLTISDNKYKELEVYHLQIGDVVMARRGEMGRCAVVEDEGLLCGTGSLLIRTKGEITSGYIQKIISFPSFKKIIEDMAVGQTMPNLNVPIVSNFQIIKPPLKVQKDYYAFVAEVDKLKFEQQRELEKAQSLFDSLMQQYFG